MNRDRRAVPHPSFRHSSPFAQDGQGHDEPMSAPRRRHRMGGKVQRTFSIRQDEARQQIRELQAIY